MTVHVGSASLWHSMRPGRSPEASLPVLLLDPQRLRTISLCASLDLKTSHELHELHETTRNDTKQVELYNDRHVLQTILSGLFGPRLVPDWFGGRGCRCRSAARRRSIHRSSHGPGTKNQVHH